jgi:hypothetical protein
VRDTDARVEQPEVVVDLGDRANRGTRVPARIFSVDGDGRREALDAVHVGLVHLAEEHPCVGGKTLDIPALAVGKDRIERQRALSRPGQPCKDNKLVTWQLKVDVLQIVLSGAFYHNDVASHKSAPFL